jgi:hypothetical protein
MQATRLRTVISGSPDVQRGLAVREKKAVDIEIVPGAAQQMNAAAQPLDARKLWRRADILRRSATVQVQQSLPWTVASRGRLL